MVAVADIVGYILAIAVAKAVGYILARYHFNRKKSLLVDAINDVAELISNNGNNDPTRKLVSNVLKEVAWYIKNEKFDDKTSLLEDVKKHLEKGTKT